MMSKIVVEEFDVCHKFMNEEIKYFLLVKKKENTWKLAMLLAVQTLVFLFLMIRIILGVKSKFFQKL